LPKPRQAAYEINPRRLMSTLLHVLKITTPANSGWRSVPASHRQFDSTFVSQDARGILRFMDTKAHVLPSKIPQRVHQHLLVAKDPGDGRFVAPEKIKVTAGVEHCALLPAAIFLRRRVRGFFSTVFAENWNATARLATTRGPSCGDHPVPNCDAWR